MKIDVKFPPKTKVIIDGCHDLVAVVTFVRLHPDSVPQYNVEWMVDGNCRVAVIDEFRLEAV